MPCAAAMLPMAIGERNPRFGPVSAPPVIITGGKRLAFAPETPKITAKRD